MTQHSPLQISGYDLIVAKLQSSDHDGLSRLVLFRHLCQNTPFIAITREHQSAGSAFGGAAARARHAWLLPLKEGRFEQLRQVTDQALTGAAPAILTDLPP